MIRADHGAVALIAALALALGVAACEPSGPGELTATVQAPVPTGAVVIELAGARITGFDGVGDTRTYAAEAVAGDTVQRVIVVSPTGASLRFRVRVEDVGAEPPRGAVIEAVDPTNRRITALTGYMVRVAR
ncbi:MAG: hypothetical protein EXR95_02520 [Gemmatimonadetes bacterium]|nr:hypothetical protein [Gemmatimonadota bacterium]